MEPMPFPLSLAALILGLSGWLHGALDIAHGPVPAVQRMVVRDDIIMHVPIANRRLPPLEWIERKGPKCVPAGMIAGAAMASPSEIDFTLRDRRRIRARLDSDCAGLDFYGGFYVEPEGGAVCARRDEIRSRAGSSCRIEGFKRLEGRLKR